MSSKKKAAKKAAAFKKEAIERLTASLDEQCDIDLERVERALVLINEKSSFLASMLHKMFYSQEEPFKGPAFNICNVSGYKFNDNPKVCEEMIKYAFRKYHEEETKKMIDVDAMLVFFKYIMDRHEYVRVEQDSEHQIELLKTVIANVSDQMLLFVRT